MAVFDCFTFFNELDLLELRLREMNEAVDRFVIVEAPWTFRGDPKPLFFAENKERFSAFLNKIIHVVVHDEIETDDPWAREKLQRDAIRRGLADAKPDDTIIVSDVDEILKPRAIREAVAYGALCHFDQSVHHYFLDLVKPDAYWAHAFAIPARLLRYMTHIGEARAAEQWALYERLNMPYHVIRDAGWHFTWIGQPERIREKLGAYSHSEPEYERCRDEDVLAKAIRARRFALNDGRLALADFATLPVSVQARADEMLEFGLLSGPANARRMLARLWDGVVLAKLWAKGRRLRMRDFPRALQAS
ncbi:MAG: hypothetical protein ABW199_09285 [Caulobacterales bacterium]